VRPEPAHPDRRRLRSLRDMEVLIAGGHGQIALRLERLLARGGHRPRGLIRNPAHAADLEAAGAEAVLCDLEHDDPRPHVGGADAIVYAAGAGPGSGAARKRTMDFGGAVKLIDAARDLGVTRWLMVSSMGAGDPDSAPEAMRPYQQAKHDADEALKASGLDWTTVRPGALTNEPGTGYVELAPRLARRGEVPRDDVALVLLEALDAPSTVGVTFEVLAGETAARDAVRGL
jgi:nucleoside-diphosphate-sugar epimerase